MPIYAYKCESCGHRQDVLQKISDPLLTVCPSCGAEAFSKQVTAAGFQLKGSGWYATDFRNGGAGAKAEKTEEKKDEKGTETKPDAAPAPVAGAAKPAEARPAEPASPAPAPAPSTPSSGS
jgi:putative FmdB family regulatory protein